MVSTLHARKCERGRCWTPLPGGKLIGWSGLCGILWTTRSHKSISHTVMDMSRRWVDNLSHESKKGWGTVVSWETGGGGGGRERTAGNGRWLGQILEGNCCCWLNFCVLTTLVNSRGKGPLLSTIGRILFLLCCAACHLLPLWSQSTHVFPALSYWCWNLWTFPLASWHSVKLCG